MAAVRLHPWVALRALLLAVGAAALIGACGNQDDPGPLSQPPTAGSDEAPGDGAGGGEAAANGEGRGGRSQKPPDAPGSGPAESGADDPRLTAAERAAAAAVRAYVAALDARNGERLCELLAPGALAEIELPRERGDCAESLRASIGYRDPRGLPVFDAARLAELASIELDGDEAKVVATVVTTFADRTQPSLEDDVIYLQRTGGNWVVSKPSATLHRAVGIADVPPTVLAPP